MRLDLLRDATGTVEFKEDEVFDFYYDIWPMEDGYRVLSKMPLYDILSKRLIYIVTNTRHMRRKKVYMLPFLHERKILLRRLDPQF